MRVLNSAEVQNISGGGALIGNALIGSVQLGNNFLNTPLISSVGTVFSAIGGPLTLIHQAADLGGYGLSLAVAGLGSALGGTGSVNYHYLVDQAKGQYYF